MRRFAAFALAASLLHLNFVRADAACRNNAHVDNAGQSTAGHAMDHHAEIAVAALHEADAQAVAGHEESCETPTQPDCCQALASCSTAFGGDVDSAVGSYVPSDEVAVTAPIEIPLSRVTTPDPPPPKA